MKDIDTVAPTRNIADTDSNFKAQPIYEHSHEEDQYSINKVDS